MRFFKNFEKAFFLSRPNRFTIVCDLFGKKIKAYLPNSGRLWELLLPGTQVYLEMVNKEKRKMPYTVVAVSKKNQPIVIHTHKANDVAGFLIKKGLVPGLDGVTVIKKEVKKGNSRFDFLLKKGPMELFLEVKLCTLSSGKVAMFPDAPTARGKKHIQELMDLSSKKTKSAVLFLIESPQAEIFLPDYHTDLDFAITLYSAKDKIMIIPLSIRWSKNLSLSSDIKLLPVPWKVVEREARDSGSYLLILRLPKKVSLEVGNLGIINFKRGYYIYVGSAKRNLSKRIERHRRLRKRMFWHIDFLRAATDVIAAIPVRTEDDLECKLAQALEEFSDWEVARFGSSDCLCGTHLFGMDINPIHSFQFQNLLQYFRLERLVDLI